MTRLARLVSLSVFTLALAPPVAAQKRQEKPEKKEPEKTLAPTPEAIPLERSEELSLAVGENKTLSALDVKSFAEGV